MAISFGNRNFLVNIPGVYSDVNRRSGHSAVFRFSVGELPVDVDALAFTFPQPNRCSGAHGFLWSYIGKSAGGLHPPGQPWAAVPTWTQAANCFRISFPSFWVSPKNF
jgi:hypothetical protein